MFLINYLSPSPSPQGKGAVVDVFSFTKDDNGDIFYFFTAECLSITERLAFIFQLLHKRECWGHPADLHICIFAH
jgi:hypothetical protein